MYVASYGKNLFKERIELVSELWNAGISAEFLYEDSEINIETLLEICRKSGIGWIVLARHKPSGRREQGTVKVRNVFKKTEEEGIADFIEGSFAC